MTHSEAWRRYKNEFDNMTDYEIKQETDLELRKLEEAEEWLEAVASWEAAGRPRSVKND